MKKISILILATLSVIHTFGAQRDYSDEQIKEFELMLSQLAEKQQLRHNETKNAETAVRSPTQFPILEYISHKSKNADLSVRLDTCKGKVIFDIERYENVKYMDRFALEYIPFSAKEIASFITEKNLKNSSIVCEAAAAYRLKIDPKEILKIFQDAGFENILIYEGWASSDSVVIVEWNLPLDCDTQPAATGQRR